MSETAAVQTVIITADSAEKKHRRRVAVGWMASLVFVAGFALYGLDYYALGSGQRPYSPKHAWLRPSGAIGVNLGVFGVLLFFLIYLYPLRKKWVWLGRQGNARHWLDFHVLLGLSAPFVITLHSSFKFHGFAGIAFWIMLGVSLSGIVGRYLYSQIPHHVNAAEFSRKELQDLQDEMMQQLAGQNLLRESDVRSALRLPSQQRVDQLPGPAALIYMLLLDVLRPFRIARLRNGALLGSEHLTSLGGLLPTSHRELERAIVVAREEEDLSKRILFLSRTQQGFHLWHVVHKPFSYTFAVLVLIHIGVVLMMGFF